MTSSLARASVLICAGWWFLGDPSVSKGQQTEAGRKLVETIEAAAEKGDPGKQCLFGLIYGFSGLGSAQDAAKAAYWFRKAAEQGYAEAQYCLAGCYQVGD